MANNTPIVDNAEQFMHFPQPQATSIYFEGQRPGRPPLGFVYSDVARRLENELNELKQKLIKQEIK